MQETIHWKVQSPGLQGLSHQQLCAFLSHRFLVAQLAGGLGGGGVKLEASLLCPALVYLPGLGGGEK